jgi:hypothetical protein
MQSDLEADFFEQATISAHQHTTERADHGPFSNEEFQFFVAGAKSSMGLPDSNTRETERLADMFVSGDVSGGIKDATMNNNPHYVTSQRHATTNEPPLPNVPLNSVRGAGGFLQGIINDKKRDHLSDVAHRKSDVHRALNSFMPSNTNLRPYQYNTGGKLGAHQGLGVRLDASAYNHYGRKLQPSQVPKKEPLPQIFRMTQGNAVPPDLNMITRSREDEMVVRVRESPHAAIAEYNYAALREGTKNGGVMAAPSRPDIMVRTTRRDSAEPSVLRVEQPYRSESRTHALYAQERALDRQRRQLSHTQ